MITSIFSEGCTWFHLPLFMWSKLCRGQDFQQTKTVFQLPFIYLLFIPLIIVLVCSDIIKMHNVCICTYLPSLENFEVCSHHEHDSPSMLHVKQRYRQHAPFSHIFGFICLVSMITLHWHGSVCTQPSWNRLIRPAGGSTGAPWTVVRSRPLQVVIRCNGSNVSPSRIQLVV